MTLLQNRTFVASLMIGLLSVTSLVFLQPTKVSAEIGLVPEKTVLMDRINGLLAQIKILQAALEARKNVASVLGVQSKKAAVSTGGYSYSHEDDEAPELQVVIQGTGDTTIWFEWGSLKDGPTEYTTETISLPIYGSRSIALSVTGKIRTGKEYVYRAVAKNAAGTTYGNARSFFGQ